MEMNWKRHILEQNGMDLADSDIVRHWRKWKSGDKKNDEFRQPRSQRKKICSPTSFAIECCTPSLVPTPSRKIISSHTMVSFSCEVCNDTVIKKKLDQHRQRCYGAYFTCIDCSITFSDSDYRNHTQCISEAEKYEKALYKGKKKPAKKEKPAKEEKPSKEEKPAKEEKKEKKESKHKVSKHKETKLNLSKYSNGSLYKIIKDIAKDLSKDKKDVLKQLQVAVEDGKLVVSL